MKILKRNVYSSELVNFSLEIMNSIVEDIIDLLQGKLNLLSPCRSVFVISLSCFFKMLSSISIILIKVACRVQIWPKNIAKIVASSVTVLLKMTCDKIKELSEAAVCRFFLQ